MTGCIKKNFPFSVLTQGSISVNVPWLWCSVREWPKALCRGEPGLWGAATLALHPVPNWSRVHSRRPDSPGTQPVPPGRTTCLKDISKDGKRGDPAVQPICRRLPVPCPAVPSFEAGKKRTESPSPTPACPRNAISSEEMCQRGQEGGSLAAPPPISQASRPTFPAEWPAGCRRRCTEVHRQEPESYPFPLLCFGATHEGLQGCNPLPEGYSACSVGWAPSAREGG